MANDFLSYTVTIIGGDYRQYLLYQTFVKQGFSVSGIALQNTLPIQELHAESLDNSQLLLPVAVLRPMRTFSAMVPLNNVFPCGT